MTLFTVSGRILGERIRRRFASLADAKSFASAQNARAAALAEVRHLVWTQLTPAQAGDAEIARALLPASARMIDAAKFFVANYKPVVSHEINDAIADYVDEKTNKAKNRAYTVSQIEIILKAFVRAASITKTGDITTAVARCWVYDERARREGREPVSARTQRDRYDHLVRFCRWLIKPKKWLLSNPLEDMPRPRVEMSPPAILTIEQIKSLLDTAWTDPSGPVMLPFFAVCLLSGARPFEVRAALPEHFYIEEDQGDPIFEVWKSKTPWRTVDLHEPLLGILRRCHAEQIPLAYFSKRLFDRIRKDAGVFEAWENDIQRHSFASYHYAKHRDIKWLEKNLGTSERVLFRHYIRRTVRRPEAEAFEALSVNWNAPRRVVAAAPAREGERAIREEFST